MADKIKPVGDKLKRFIGIAALAGALTSGCDDKNTGTWEDGYWFIDTYIKRTYFQADFKGYKCEAFEESGEKFANRGDEVAIDLYIHVNGKKESLVHTALTKAGEPAEYYVQQREGFRSYWTINENGEVTGVVANNMDDAIKGEPTTEDKSRRLKLFGLMQRCKGTLEEKFHREF